MVDVPFLDLQAQMRPIRAEVDAAVARVFDRCNFILGDDVEAFERAFAAYCGTSECVGVDSGMNALVLGLRAAGVGPGDEVITVAHTFIASVAAITFTGATPVLVEVNPDTYLMDPASIEAAITPRTKAILPVHLYGQTVDMDPVMEVAERHGLFVLEDAAQAHGARYKGRRAGSLGHAAAFSYYPGKNLGAAGDAGGIVTDDAAYADRVRMLRNHGQRVKYYHEVLGSTARLDTIQAAVLNVKLPHLDDWNAGRRRVAAAYAEGLADAPIALPQVAGHSEPVWHLYVVRAAQRDELLRRLTARGIHAALHYPVAIHKQQAYAHLNGQSYPVSEWIADQCLSLPMYAEMTDEQIAAVVTAVREETRDMAPPSPAPVAASVTGR